MVARKDTKPKSENKSGEENMEKILEKEAEMEKRPKAKKGSKVESGNKVCVEYEGTLDDGTVFDSSQRHGCPLEFEIGSGQIIKGFENAIIGMKKGEEKEIKINPSEAYGDINPQLIKKMPRNQLPANTELKPGMVLALGLPNGMRMPVRITEVTDELVTLDLNHPLAGKTLTFKIKLLDFS